MLNYVQFRCALYNFMVLLTGDFSMPTSTLNSDSFGDEKNQMFDVITAI